MRATCLASVPEISRVESAGRVTKTSRGPAPATEEAIDYAPKAKHAVVGNEEDGRDRGRRGAPGGPRRRRQECARHVERHGGVRFAVLRRRRRGQGMLPPPQKTPTSPRAPRGTRRAARAARAVRVQPRNAQGLSDGIARAPRSTVPQEARRVCGASRGPDLGVDQGRQGYAPPRVATAAPLVPALPRVPCCATRV